MINSIRNSNYSKNNITNKSQNAKSKVSTPAFGGVTRVFANSMKHPRPYILPCDLEYFIKKSNSKIVGKPPKEFLNIFPKEPKKVFEMLNSFSKIALDYDESFVEEKFNSVLPDEKNIDIRYIGQGSFSKAFKFNLEDKSYVVKANKDIGDQKNGFYQEVSTGLYTKNFDYKDLAKFYFADLEHKWSVYEFIDPYVASEKRKLEKSINKDYSLILGDDAPRNRINGVVVDYGEIVPFDLCERIEKKVASDIKNSTPEIMYKGLSKLCYIDEEERLSSFIKVMQVPELRKEITTKISDLNMEDRLTAFKEALKYKESQLSAIDELEELNSDDAIMAFTEALKYPRLRDDVAFTIYRLDEKHRFNAYMNAMKYPEARETAVRQIWSIEDEKQLWALEEAMKYPESFEIAKIELAKLMDKLNN